MKGSGNQPILILSGLVQGSYNYTLTVKNKRDMESSEMVIINVLPNPMDNYLLLVDLELDREPVTFTLTNQVQLLVRYPDQSELRSLH